MARAQTRYYWDFETGLQGWSPDRGIWNVGTPTNPNGPTNSSAQPAAFDGNQCAGSGLASNYPKDNDSRFISPAITLPAVSSGQSIMLGFWQWFDLPPFSVGSFVDDSAGQVEVSVWDPTKFVWSNWTTVSRSQAGSSNGWVPGPSIDLSAYAGKRIRVAFHHFGGGATAAGWFIDDVTITLPVVQNPVPVLIGISPSECPVGSPGITITLTGSGFVAGSIVNFGPVKLTPTSVTSTQITVDVPGSLLVTPHITNPYTITLTNPPPGGGTSKPLPFYVGGYPQPVLSKLSTARVLAGSATFKLTLSGKYFVQGATASTVWFGGTMLSNPTVVSTTQIQVQVPATMLTTAGKFLVVVKNPKPGGGNSNSITFSVVNPTPVLSNVTPDHVTVGAPDTTITLAGSGFYSGSQVLFDGTPLTTTPTLVSATKLTAVIPASLLATAGDHDIAVTNPGPGGGTSASVNFSVLNPTPILTTMSITSATHGSTGFLLTLNGKNFVKGATSATSSVMFGGTVLNNGIVA